MRIKALFSGLCTALALPGVLAGVICVSNSHKPLLYLIDIFTLPILTVVVALTVLLAILRQKTAVAVSLVAVILLSVAIAPQVFPKQAPADMRRPAVRMIFANLFVRNTTPQRLLPWIAEKNPDIVALVEVNSFERDDMIAQLKDTYPYMATRYDMIVASRYPLSDIDPRPGGFALLTMTARTPDGPLHLALVHLTRPWPYTTHGEQSAQFDRLTHALQPMPQERRVVVGDFNTTPSAVLLHEFATSLNMHIAPALRGTWVAPLPAFLRVGIDNALASSDLNLSKRDVGPFDGSDHHPIFVEIRPAKLK